MKVGLLQFLFHETLREDIDKQHKQQGERCVFLSLFLVKRVFHRVKQTEGSTLSKNGQGNDIEPGSLAFLSTKT